MAKTEQQLHSEILQYFETEKSTVFVETVVHFFQFLILWWVESSKEQHFLYI